MWILLVILLASSPLCLAANQSVVLEPIIIEKEYAHEGTIFSQKLLSALPSDSIENTANYAASADLQKRASFGIQQDLSIRGSIFEDNSVTLNGINLNDPQTGHFSMDIPLTSADIESLRIEKNAMAVHYKIRMPPANGVTLTDSFGQNSSIDNLISCSFGTAALRNRFSFQHERSDGLRPNTDFKKYTASFSSLYSSADMELELNEGYLKKNFGADGFYGAPTYIKEEEHIEKNALVLRARIKQPFDFQITPYSIINRDRFLLDRDNPAFYTNVHHTLVLGVKNRLTLQNGLYAEIENRRENISSTNLRKHSRDSTQTTIGTEKTFWGDLSLEGSASLAFHSGKLPITEQGSCEIAYRLAPSFQPYFLFTRQYRLPSFTELYYTSPTNNGNAFLDIQSSNNFEWGIRHRQDRSFLSVATFLKIQRNTIDWVRDVSSTPWQAENIGKLNARGFDVAYSIKTPSEKHELACNYTFLHLDKDTPHQFSKYVFSYLRHKVVLLYHYTWQRFTVTPALIYEQPNNGSVNSRWLANIKASISPQRNLTYFVEIDNIFNTGYEEFEFIKAAGRFCKAGMTANF